MSYSLQQAAEATGKDRSTIQRAIKKGRISAPKNESGGYDIDPAELHRVFPPVAHNEAQPVAMQQNATGEIASENRELKAKVELLREMVDDLRGRLDKSEDERRATQSKLTALLTHQPKPEPEAQPTPAPEPQHTANQNDRPAAVRPWLWVALALTVVFGVAAYMYFRQQ
jgi:hypothetical protein